MLLLYAIVAGLLVGMLTGGRPAALAVTRFRWWPVALGGLLFQVLLFSPPIAEAVGPAGPALYVGSTALVLVAMLVNLRQPGFGVLAVGALLNFVVIAANGGQMPAAPEAFAALNGVAAVPVEYFSNSQLIGPHTHLPWLGDIFVLPRPLPLANVFSPGDVLIGLGGAIFIVRTMHRSTARAEEQRTVEGEGLASAERTSGRTTNRRPAAQHG